MSKDFITRFKVLAWNYAAALIKHQKLKDVWAGLKEDWDTTHGKILENGRPVTDREREGRPRTSSHWATPVISIDPDMDKAITCWLWEDKADWDKDAKWPACAIETLKAD